MSDIFEIYNPLNAKKLTQDQIDYMQHLTREEVKELARLYPNSKYHYNYLLIFDSTKEQGKTMDQLSTWPNLNALWNSNHTQFKAHNFRNNVQKVNEEKVAAKIPVHVGPKVVDLSEIEAQNAVGLKKQEAELPAEEIPQAEQIDQVTAGEEIEAHSPADISGIEPSDDKNEIPVDSNIPTGDDEEQKESKPQTPKRKLERKK